MSLRRISRSFEVPPSSLLPLLVLFIDNGVVASDLAFLCA